MISIKNKFIFVHIPKTGGNSIQSLLLPYSDDQKTLSANQDGTERFNIRGAITPKKHATLSDYQQRLTVELSTFSIVTAVRHPFPRAVSGYFSPHRWLAKQGDQLVPQVPSWDENRFFEFLEEPYQCPAVEYLRVQDAILRPDFIVRHECFARGVAELCKYLKIPGTHHFIPHRNQTTASDEVKEWVLRSGILARRVEEIYVQDMNFFNYAPFST